MGPPRLPLPPGARRPCWGALKLEDGEDAPNAVDAAVTPAAICDRLELCRARLQLRLAGIRLLRLHHLRQGLGPEPARNEEPELRVVVFIFVRLHTPASSNSSSSSGACRRRPRAVLFPSSIP